MTYTTNDVLVMYNHPMKKIRMNVYLLERQLKALEAESRQTGSSVAELIRRAIDVIYKPKAKR